MEDDARRVSDKLRVKANAAAVLLTHKTTPDSHGVVVFSVVSLHIGSSFNLTSL